MLMASGGAIEDRQRHRGTRCQATRGGRRWGPERPAGVRVGQRSGSCWPWRFSLVG